MQQRSEPHDSLDDFPTPPWATRTLCEILEAMGLISPDMTAREPCANRGHMVRALQEYFRAIDALDVHDYGAGFRVADFLFPEPIDPVDWTFMNPPFRLAFAFIERALATSEKGVVVIARSAFLEGDTRYKELFKRNPPYLVLQYCERVVMLKGRMVRAGDRDPTPENPKKTASSATAYSALIWQKTETNDRVAFDWIPSCRRRLERPGDYPDDPRGLADLQR